MTAKENIIYKIMSSKNRPHLDFSLKYKTEKFTDNLFHTLFDANACVAKNIEQLEIDFEEIYKLACVNDKESFGTIWKIFLSTLPEILENLNLDAQELVKNDPASNNIEEVYLAYQDFMQSQFTVLVMNYFY